jgi:tight adherence protein B
MKRLLALVVAVTAVMAALSAPAADAAPRSLHLALSPAMRFPDRQFTIDLPAGVSPYTLRVTENGIPVIAHLTPIDRNGVPVSVAVMLDTSDSMRGRALRAAVDAARTLIDDKPARSEAAIFGFARTPYLIHPWSTSAAALDASLGSVDVSEGTAIWDAVGMASQSVGARPGASRVLVLLTDGSDTSSGATVSEAAKAARSVHARVFVVGLPGAQTNRANLERLVHQTGGTFVQVRSFSQLHAVYAGLATELGHQYLLAYTSQQRGTGNAVIVRVTAGGLVATDRYTIPPLPGVSTAPLTSWWATRQALNALASAVGVIVLLVGYMLLRPKRRNPVRRLRGYGLGGPPVQLSDLTSLMSERPHRNSPRPGARNVWARFAADVERGEIGPGPVRTLLIGLAIGTAAAGAAALTSGQPLALAGGPIVGAIGAWAYVTNRASAWYRHFDSQLPDALTVLASSLRAGHSLLQAVDHVAEEADEKTAPEWRELVRQTQLGVPVEDAIDAMTHRIGSRELHWISLVARVQHQVGGNMAEMFDIVADTVRQRYRLSAQVHALTAQGRMTRWVLTIAPFALGGILAIMSPSYINVFFGSKVGLGLMIASTILIAIGSLWIKKIVEIEV